jgi:hypothetical protein
MPGMGSWVVFTVVTIAYSDQRNAIGYYLDAKMAKVLPTINSKSS